MLRISSLLLFMLFTLPSQAVDLEYKGFYKRLDLIKENNLDSITMAFYLVDSYTRKRCQLNKAVMYGQDMTPEQISISDEQQLLVPYSKEYYDSFAILNVVQKDQGQNCTLQMQIQSKDKKQTEFTFAELVLVHSQMQDLVDDFGSFLWFMMPDVAGLHIELEDTEQVSFLAESLKPHFNCEQLSCKLEVSEQMNSTEKAISFTKPPVVIAPWIKKD